MKTRTRLSKLDFGGHEGVARLESCLSVPLVGKDVKDALVGVLTLYASERMAFTDQHTRLVESVAPHLVAALAAVAEPHPATARDLRLVSSR